MLDVDNKADHERTNAGITLLLRSIPFPGALSVEKIR